MQENLAVCPFCGSNELNIGEQLVECNKCLVEHEKSLWNTRHSTWISIKNKRPNIGEFILIRYKHEDVSCDPKEIIKISLAISDLSFISIEINDPNLDPFILIPNKEKVLSLHVTHWMPLPQPPKETE